jgi:peptide deformylase
MNVTATGFTAHGAPVQVVGKGLLARCIQHETDHLDGVLFIDRQDPERQRRIIATLREATWFDSEEVVIKPSPH